MQEKLERLYKECSEELRSIGINIETFGNIQIKISQRAKKRYGCCKQEEPDKKTRYRESHKIRYGVYNKHIIEISAWLMELDETIIKNTIIHEIIHCMPYCNNHGSEFKKYAEHINKRLGYNITREGNKEEDYRKSNIEYHDDQQPKYKVQCCDCGQVFYRQRITRGFTRKYRCGICNGKFNVTFLQ